MKTKLLPLLFCVTIFLSSKTIGQLQIENNCNQALEIAIKYIDKNSSSYWTSEGWFKIKPGETGTIISDPLVNRYIYFYAQSENSDYVWSGDLSTCISYSKFRYWEGFANQECPDVLKFKTIDTKGATNYTYKLTCTGNEYNGFFNPVPLNPELPPWLNQEKKSKNNNNQKKSNVENAINFVWIKKERENCPMVNCAYTHVYILNNDHYSTRISVKYEKLNWKGDHIATYNKIIDARETMQIGNNYNEEYFRILTATFTN